MRLHAYTAALLASGMLITMETSSTQKPDAPVTHVPVPHPEVRLTGRFHAVPGSRVSFAWPGTEITVRFSGSAVDATIEDHPAGPDDVPDGNILGVRVDDQPMEKLVLNKGRTVYRLCESLPSGEHTLTLIKLTEPSIGMVSVSALTIHGGDLLPAPPRPERRIEFFGDSITCGYGNEGRVPDEPFSPSTENHFLSFAQIAARAVGAEAHVAAWSGEGIIRNAVGDVVHPIPSLYDQVLPPSRDPAWNFSAWQPQVVVINLGTNDFLTGIPDREEFLSAYLAFIDTLSRLYGNPLFICCLGPMISDTEPAGEERLTKARRYLDELLRRAKARGIHTIYALEFDELTPDERGAWWHPNLAAHRRMADALVGTLEEQLNWRRMPRRKAP